MECDVIKMIGSSEQKLVKLYDQILFKLIYIALSKGWKDGR